MMYMELMQIFSVMYYGICITCRLDELHEGFFHGLVNS